MAGHSKWANIQHRKKAQDAKRGKLFTKLIREITIAARMGGADINTNPRLRLAVDKALIGNMTRDTIDRAIKRGAGSLDDKSLEQITYEGYGAAGVAIMVECLSDNRNRTVAEVRHAFTKCNGNLGTDGSVAYLFTNQGIIVFDASHEKNKIEDIAIEAGAEDILNHDDNTVEIRTTPESFMQVKETFVQAGLEPEAAYVTMVPSMEVSLDIENGEKIMKLVELLEDLDDVQNVYTNADLPEDLLKE